MEIIDTLVVWFFNQSNTLRLLRLSRIPQAAPAAFTIYQHLKTGRGGGGQNLFFDLDCSAP